MNAMPGRMPSVFGFTLLAGLAASLALTAARAQSAPDYKALLNTPDRSPADLKADQRRDPVPLLVFSGVRPGMRKCLRYGGRRRRSRPN